LAKIPLAQGAFRPQNPTKYAAKIVATSFTINLGDFR
jgi:hypothetical protein